MSADMERVRHRDKWLHEGMKLDWPDFDDWLARVKREAKAEALDDAANTFRGDQYTGREVETRLHARATTYREQGE